MVLKSASVKLNLIFVENRDTLRIRSSLVFDSLRARVTAEKDLVMLKKCVCEG